MRPRRNCLPGEGNTAMQDICRRERCDGPAGLMLAAAHGWQGGPDAVRAAFLSTIYGAGGLAAARGGGGSS